MAVALAAACSGAAGRDEARGPGGAVVDPATRVARYCHGPRPDRLTRARCGRALLASGEAREDAGDVAGAIDRYAAIAAAAEAAAADGAAAVVSAGPGVDVDLVGIDRRAITDEVVAECRFRAGRLAYDAGQPERAGALLWGLVVLMPDEPRAGDAIAYLVARVRGDQPVALWQRLTALATALPDRAVTDNLVWWLADLAEHELADPAAAQILYDRLPVDHPRSGMRDDARWRGAVLARARGDAAGAVARLRGLLATREVARGTGSYFSIWLDDAQLLLATVLRDDLGDHRAAAAAFARLPRDYPRSILVDDALIGLAELALADGDLAGACRAAARLQAHDPASRFAARAAAIAGRPDCPGPGHRR